MNRPKYFFLSIVCMLILAAALSSCHKKSSVPQETAIGAFNGPDIDGDSSEPASFAATNGLWKTLETPVSIRISQPMNLGLKGRLTMVKDSWILMSLRFLGMEVGQLYMDTDSVFIVEKMKRTYYAEGLTGVRNMLGMDLGLFQGYLIGRPTVFPEMSESVFPVTMINDETDMVENIIFFYNSEELLRLGYGSSIETPTGLTASGIDFLLTLPRFRAEASMSWDASQMKWDTMPENKFTRPGSRYTRVRNIQEFIMGLGL